MVAKGTSAWLFKLFKNEFTRTCVTPQTKQTPDSADLILFFKKMLSVVWLKGERETSLCNIINSAIKGNCRQMYYKRALFFLSLNVWEFENFSETLMQTLQQSDEGFLMKHNLVSTWETIRMPKSLCSRKHLKSQNPFGQILAGDVALLR